MTTDFSNRKTEAFYRATGLGDLMRPGNRLQAPKDRRRGSGVFASTTNGGYTSSGSRQIQPNLNFKLSTIIERKLDMREPIHPGETLREDLDALGISASELARRIQVPVNRITEILNGRQPVTDDTALRLGRFFHASGEFWLNLQRLYELRLAEQKHG